MKKLQYISSLLVSILCIASTTKGQEPVTVIEKQLGFKHGNYPGFELIIPEVDAATIQKEWIRKLEQSTKSKVVADLSELTIFGAKIESLYTNPINVYSKITSLDSAVRLEVVYELTPKTYICEAQSPGETARAKQYLFEFGRDQFALLAKEALKAEEKTLRILEQKLDALYSDKSKLDRAIVDARNSIAQNENGISSMKAELITLNEQLNAEQTALAVLTVETAIEQKKSQIKELEKKIKKTMDNINSNEKEIVDNKSTINESEQEISTNLKDQESVRYQIEGQKPKVQAAEKKYNAIVSSTLNN